MISETGLVPLGEPVVGCRSHSLGSAYTQNFGYCTNCSSVEIFLKIITIFRKVLWVILDLFLLDLFLFSSKIFFKGINFFLLNKNDFCNLEKLCTSTPHFTALRFIALHRYCIFCKLKVCGNPALSKSIGTIFPTAFAYFMSLCHVLVILSIFQTFLLLLHLLWWPVVSDLWCHYCNWLGKPQTTPI